MTTSTVARPPLASRAAATTLATGRFRAGLIRSALPLAPDDEFRLNLEDLPRGPIGLNVDGFKATLFSRLLDFVDRLRSG